MGEGLGEREGDNEGLLLGEIETLTLGDNEGLIEDEGEVEGEVDQ